MLTHKDDSFWPESRRVRDTQIRYDPENHIGPELSYGLRDTTYGTTCVVISHRITESHSIRSTHGTQSIIRILHLSKPTSKNVSRAQRGISGTSRVLYNKKAFNIYPRLSTTLRVSRENHSAQTVPFSKNIKITLEWAGASFGRPFPAVAVARPR